MWSDLPEQIRKPTVWHTGRCGDTMVSWAGTAQEGWFSALRWLGPAQPHHRHPLPVEAHRPGTSQQRSLPQSVCWSGSQIPLFQRPVPRAHYSQKVMAEPGPANANAGHQREQHSWRPKQGREWELSDGQPRGALPSLSLLSQGQVL